MAQALIQLNPIHEKGPESFILAYDQATNPMVLFLYDYLYSLVRKIMPWFIKPTIFQKVNSGSERTFFCVTK